MRSTALGLLLAATTISAAPAAEPRYSVVAQLPAGDGGWDLASVDPQTQRLYVARTDGVTMIDLKTGKATDRFVGGQHVHAALVVPGTHDVIATNGETNNAVLFDGQTGQIRATIQTGTKPDAATYDPVTHTVWVMNPGSGDVTVINPTSAKVIATVPVGGSLELGASDGKGHIYVNVEDKNEVVVLDTRRRKVLSRFPLKDCDGPTGIAYDTKSHEIVSACANGVAIISKPDGSQVAKLPIGKGADGAAFDEQHEVALIPAGRDGNLTLIKLGATPTVIGQTATAVSARTIAVNPSTGRAYLPSAKLAPPVGNDRPKPVPGSFRVLVVSP
jgi:YVTN family beta-propeller protein